MVTSRSTRLIKELPATTAERAIRIMSGRWKIHILWQIMETELRPSELKARLPGISQKMLIQQLRELEEHGLVKRRVHPESPVRVGYRATRLGRSVRPMILALCRWGRRHQSATNTQLLVRND